MCVCVCVCVCVHACAYLCTRAHKRNVCVHTSTQKVYTSTQEECVCAHKYTKGVHEYTWGNCARGTVILIDDILGQTSNLSKFLKKSFIKTSQSTIYICLLPSAFADQMKYFFSLNLNKTSTSLFLLCLPLDNISSSFFLLFFSFWSPACIHFRFYCTVIFFAVQLQY